MTARRITVRGAARAAARTGVDCDGEPVGLPYKRRLLTYGLRAAVARSAASLQMAAAQKAPG